MRVYRLWRRSLAALLILGVLVLPAAHADDEAEAKARAAARRAEDLRRSHEAHQEVLTNLILAAGRVRQYEEEEPHSGALSSARRALSKRERQFRAFIAYLYKQRIAVRSGGADQTAQIDASYSGAEQRLRVHRELLASDVSKVTKRTADKAKRSFEIGKLEGALIAVYTETAVLAEMQTVDTPTAQGTPLTARRLERLATRIVEQDPGNPIGSSEIDINILRQAARMDHELAEREFTRLAARGLIVDPSTNHPVEGKLRIEIARNAEANLSDYLHHKGKRTPTADLFSWDDTRPEIAARIEDRVKRTPEYQALLFLDSSIEPNFSEYCRAVAVAIRGEQGQVNDWYRNEFVGGGMVDVGLGKALRVLNVLGTGEAGDRRVRARIGKFMTDSDAAADAFEAAAAAGTPGAMEDPAQRSLLKSYGYITEGEGEEEVFQIPYASRAVASGIQGMRDGANLPGASWLDVISPKNVGIALVSIVVPELAAMRLASVAGGLGAGARTMMAVRILSEIGVGSAVDAGLEKLEKGSVEWDRLLLESALLGGVLMGMGELNNHAMREGMHRLAKSERNTWLHKSLREDPAFRRRLESSLGGMLNLTTDTALQTFYQAKINDGELDSYTILSTLLQGALTQSVAKGWGDVRDRGVELGALERFMPDWLRERVGKDLRLGKELLRAVRVRLRHRAEVLDRFDELTSGGRDLDAPHIFKKLLRGDLGWEELKLIYYERPKQTATLRHEIRKMREDYFKEMVFTAQVVATRWLDKRIAGLKAKEIVKAGGRLAAKAELLALDQLRMRELDLIAEGIFAPGSKDPTSDIDRSSDSHILRRALICVYESRAETFAKDGFPTSAKAFDVNEYLNVFPFIKENQAYVERTRTLPRGAADFGVVFHRHEMLAVTISAAMQHMTPAQTTRYMANRRARIQRRIDAGKATDTDLQRLEYLLTEAQRSLAETNGELGKERAKVIARTGLDPSDPEVDRHAKEALYLTRTKEISEKLWELDVMEAAGGAEAGEALELRAEIELLMSKALRDGIETYSSPSGLDIVVNQVQTAKRKDGTKMSLGDRMVDPNFDLTHDLKMYEKSDIEGMLNDQVMFLVEHVNGYRTGHEWPHQAGRAMGKYLQRMFLGLKIQGLDVASLKSRPEYDPTRRLYEASQALLKVKSSPKGINKVLSDLALSARRTPDAGMGELLKLMEAVIPGMKGLTGSDVLPEPRGPDGAVRTNKAYRGVRLRLREDLEDRMHLFDAIGGGALCVAELRSCLTSTRAELNKLKAEMTRMEAYARQYLEDDWPRAVEIQEQLKNLRLLTSCIPWKNDASPTYQQLKKEKRARETELDGLKERFKFSRRRIAGRLYKMSPPYAQASDRRDWLEELSVLLVERLGTYREQARREAAFERMDFSGDWEAGPGRRKPGTAKATYENGVMTILLHWKDLPGRAPHVEIRAWHARGRLHGRWRALYLDGRQEGLFEARFRPDGKSFQLTDRSVTDPRVPIEWPALVFTRPDAGAVDTDRGWIRTSTQAVPQTAWKSRAPERPGDGLGRVTVHALDVSGRLVHTPYDAYLGDQWVASGQTGTPEDLGPGSYNFHLDRWGHDAWVRGVRVVAGAAITVPGPQRGGVHLSMRDEKGDAIPLRGVRLYKDRQRVAHASERLADERNIFAAMPGTYDVAFTLGGVTYRRSATLEAGKLTVLEARPGGVGISPKAVDGTILKGTYRVYQRAQPEQAIFEYRGLRTVLLGPGSYRLEFDTGPWSHFEDFDVDSESFSTWATWFARFEFEGVGEVAGLKGVAIRRAAVKDTTTPWFGLPAGREHFDTPPGTYDIRWMVGARTFKRTVTVVAKGRERIDLRGD